MCNKKKLVLLAGGGILAMLALITGTQPGFSSVKLSLSSCRRRVVDVSLLFARLFNYNKAPPREIPGLGLI